RRESQSGDESPHSKIPPPHRLAPYSIRGRPPPHPHQARDMPSDLSAALPRVLADLPVSPLIVEMLRPHVLLVPWQAAAEPGGEQIAAIYTHGHPLVDGALLDVLPG